MNSDNRTNLKTLDKNVKSIVCETFADKQVPRRYIYYADTR